MSTIRLIFILPFLSWALWVHAQSVDELQNNLKKAKTPAEQADMLNRIGIKYRDLNQLDQAIDYHFQALDLFEELNDKNGQAETMNFLGGIYWRMNNFDQAVHYYTLALQIREEEQNTEEIAKILNNLGLASRSLRDYNTALEYYHRALNNWISVGNQKETAVTFNNIGNVYLNRNVPDSALANYNKALEIRQELEDTISIAATLNNMATLFKNQNEFTKAVEIIQESIDLLNEVNDLPGLADNYNNLGGVYWLNKEYKKSLENYLKALSIREDLDDRVQVAATMNNIGLIYKDLGNFEKALEYYEQSLALYRVMNDRFMESEALNFIGGVYWQSGDFERARDLYLQSLGLRKVVGDKKYIARTYNNLALVYKSMDERDSALMNYQSALSIYKEIGDQKNVASILNNIGNLYKKFKEYDEAIQFFKIALEIRQETNDLSGIAFSSLDLGNCYAELRQFNLAIGLFDRSLKIAESMKNTDLEKDVLNAFALAYAGKGDYQNAFINFSKYDELKDKILSTESIKKIADMQIRYETEKKEKELRVKDIQLIRQKDKNRRQRNMIYTGLSVLFLISVFVIFIVRQNGKIRKANELLELRNIEVLQQKEEIAAQRDAIGLQKEEIEKQRDIAEKQRDKITEQKQKITDSIEYASRIQAAVLPPEQLLKAVLPEYFIFFRPRDIVSGDFYWVSKDENQAIVAAVDCTGHGVPGAFMSMLGTTLISEIVAKKQFNNAAGILNQLRGMVKNALHQTGAIDDSTSDGMDCALCMIDFEHRKLQFAGANNPLFIIRNNELIEYEADRMPIGVHMLEEVPFTNRLIELQTDDMLYLFSDGYYDQFGGEKGRKLLTKNFKDILLQVHQLDMPKQNLEMERQFNQWKGDNRQIDDVLVIGIRVS